MHAGIGTYMDTPSHCIADEKLIHDFDVNDWIIPCVVLNISDKYHNAILLSAQDVEDFESKYRLISKGSCAISKTGENKFWQRLLEYHNTHVVSSVLSQAVELFRERGVRAIGVDTI